MDIKDKIAVITGGASGIGKAMATRFLAEGAKHVVIADLQEQQLHEVAEDIGAQAVKTDVAVEEEVISLIQSVESAQGQIDILNQPREVSKMHAVQFIVCPQL